MTNKTKLPTFKEWSMLHENFLGGITPLGVQQANVVGGLIGQANIDSLDESLDELDIDSLERLEEACKKAKAKKKMLADFGKKKPEVDLDLEKKPDGEEEVDVDEKPDHDEPDGDEDGEKDGDGDEDDNADAKIVDKGPEDKPEIMLAKKKAKKKMTKEETEWWSSVKSNGSLENDDEGNWDGLGEPKAGEPGFAPVGRVGWF